ncbi:MAG: diaminopimelate epimerase [Prevotella sp.]|nr:diaminopimelate epimerase [Bacteroides sp.]MCM1365618.1 diaminopimelate epimerase [Prevotella sp.]
MCEYKEISFVKMEGAGNDYIYVMEADVMGISLSDLSIKVSNRHFGIGADGLVVIGKSNKADFSMRIFNADGSEAQMCGNASRCVGKYVYEHGMTKQDKITLETKAGIKTIFLNLDNNRVVNVTVDMLSPILIPEQIPVIAELKEDNIIRTTCEADGKVFKMTCVGMGNPHGVIFVNEIEDSDVIKRGKLLECAPQWPEKTNIEFVRVIDSSNIEMRVWERGSGETLACGTGSCASVVACVLEGKTDREVNVHLRGGILKIKWDEMSDHIYMTGPAQTICTGIYYYYS